MSLQHGNSAVMRDKVCAEGWRVGGPVGCGRCGGRGKEVKYGLQRWREVKYGLQRSREVVMRCDGGGAFACSSMRDLQALPEEEEQGGGVDWLLQLLAWCVTTA
jgi:hypothetical protein